MKEKSGKIIRNFWKFWKKIHFFWKKTRGRPQREAPRDFFHFFLFFKILFFFFLDFPLFSIIFISFFCSNSNSSSKNHGIFEEPARSGTPELVRSRFNIKLVSKSIKKSIKNLGKKSKIFEKSKNFRKCSRGPPRVPQGPPRGHGKMFEKF